VSTEVLKFMCERPQQRSEHERDFSEAPLVTWLRTRVNAGGVASKKPRRSNERSYGRRER
jgi:hypothetical protein